MKKQKTSIKFDGVSLLPMPTVQGLTRFQVEIKTLPRGAARNRKEAHDRRLAQGQISPRRLCRFHSLSV